MVDEVQKTCPSCGAPLKEGASFCTSCGAALGAPDAATAGETTAAADAATPVPTPPPAAVPPQAAPPAGGGVPGMPVQGMAPPTAAKRSKVPLLIGVIGGILVIAGIVVLVVWLTVWKDGSGGGTGDPIALAEKYISAMENKDADSFFECFEPEFFSSGEFSLLEEMGMDAREMIEMAFELSEFRFDGYALELDSESGDAATVVTTSGTLTTSALGFEEEYDLADEPLVFEMVKVDGRWYLSDDPMPGSMGGDIDLDSLDFEDFDFDDLDTEDLDSGDLDIEDLDIEELKDLLPEELEDLNLEDLDIEDLEKLLEDLEKQLEGTKA
ncbi:MAG: zinc ribbon domain-containing protein [Actinobacteria bacterium]|nr:zinc ribbon domain-containing protein [Actinomycetota bacterium]